MKRTLTILVLLSFYSGLAQGLTEEHTTDLYTIKYPKSWIFSADDQMGATFHILSPKDSEEDVFNENVNLIIQDLAGTNIDLDAFVQLSEKQIKELIPKSNIIRSERLKSGSLELHKVVYTGEINGFNLKLIQHYQINNDKAYILTFTAQESAYEGYKYFGQQILNSFRWK